MSLDERLDKMSISIQRFSAKVMSWVLPKWVVRRLQED
jgi:hypothetical protein